MDINIVIPYIIGVVIAWIIFYHVIKAAVRNGIREARRDLEVSQASTKSIQEKAPNARRLQLQDQYNKGQITFEAYKAEWDKY